jgi:diguanylate cyclase (GGDEF)-like protein
MPKLGHHGAMEFAERLRITVSEINTRYSGHDFSVTVSCGVSTANEDDLSLDPLIKRADLALYSAKHNGRNCVVCDADSLVIPLRVNK